jgi:hypothetical protein
MTAAELLAETEAPVGLASLAGELGFDVLYDAVVTAVADRFDFRVHYDVRGLRNAYTEWVEGHPAKLPGGRHDQLVAVLARLIATLARHRIVSFTAMMSDPADSAGFRAVCKRHPNETVALMLGAALYGRAFERMAGHDPVGFISPEALADGAEALRRDPAAAANFRALLGLRLAVH